MLQSFLHTPLICFDAGARGGWKEMEKLSSHIRYTGFEPDPVAYEELRKIVQQTAFASAEISPLALWSGKGKLTLNISERPSMSSLLPFDEQTFDKHFGAIRDAEKWKAGISSGRKIEVDTITLDEYCASSDIPYIDYLKMDTQGAEREILSGAERMIASQSISVLKTEVNFIPVYKGQASFSELDQFLKQKGFEFIDCRFYPNGVKQPVSAGKKTVYESPKIYNGGDAYYMMRPEAVKAARGEYAVVCQAVVLAALGYYSEARFIFKTFTGIKDEAIRSLFREIHPVTKRPKELLRNWIPPALLHFFRKD
jgi:FkbM family methyltransferase